MGETGSKMNSIKEYNEVRNKLKEEQDILKILSDIVERLGIDVTPAEVFDVLRNEYPNIYSGDIIVTFRLPSGSYITVGNYKPINFI